MILGPLSTPLLLRRLPPAPGTSAIPGRLRAKPVACRVPWRYPGQVYEAAFERRRTSRKGSRNILGLAAICFPINIACSIAPIACILPDGAALRPPCSEERSTMTGLEQERAGQAVDAERWS